MKGSSHHPTKLTGSVSVCAKVCSPIFSLAQAFTPGFLCHRNTQPPLGGFDWQRAAQPQDGSPSTSLRTSPVNGAPSESAVIANPGLKAWATENQPLAQIATLPNQRLYRGLGVGESSS